MEYKQLGRSALRISRIGFGCMSLGNDQSAVDRLLHQAIDGGINFFDTADLYGQGQNETMVGRALRGRRQEVMLATKVGNQWRANGSGWDWNPRKAYILEAAEKSLQRLGTDHIDLYQLHGGTLEDDRAEVIEAFQLLQQQGKVRYYAISSIRPNVIREYIKESAIVSVMMQYSLLDRRPEESCLTLLEQNQVGVLARGAVAKGLLVNKPAEPFLQYHKEAVVQAANSIRAISGEARSAAQTALRFVCHHPAITSAVVGIRTPEQLKEALATFDTPMLSDAEYKKLQSSIHENYYSDHR